MKKILVTGCTGLLATRFIEKYHQTFKITALSRTPVNKPISGVTYLLSDYSCKSLEAIFAAQDAVVHLAASRLYSGNDCYAENTRLDANVFQAAEQAAVPHLLFASTRGVYGTSDCPWFESDAVAPQNSYALGKAQSELLALYSCRTKGVRITSLRLAQILSDKEFEGSMLRTFFDQAKAGLPLNVTVTGINREYLYIDDAADALKLVIDSNAESGNYNLGSGETVTIEATAQAIAAAYGVDVKQSAELKVADESSLMDSAKFRNTFNWQPSFTFKQAVKDITQK